VIAIVSSRHDETALALVARWSRWGAALIDADDLVQPGWRLRSDDPAATRLVVAGRVVPASALSGIVVRRPCVFEPELARIKPADRAYVASETGAFLAALLSRIECPVLNRPCATSLGGPAWRPEQWARTAVELGIPVAPVRRRAGRAPAPQPEADEPGAPIPVVVVGDRCLGADGEPAAQALQLAHRVGVELLAVVFRRRGGRAELTAVSPWPDLREPVVADAVLARLRRDGP
jgi:hypothetical protein